MRRFGARRLPSCLLTWLLLAAPPAAPAATLPFEGWEADPSPSEGWWVARYYGLDHRIWKPELAVDTTPKPFPMMVIWEVSQYPDAEPTPEQRAAAEDLVERCRAAAQRNGWHDYWKAIEDGYELLYQDQVHYVNRDHVLDDRLLDPDHPEFLMYYDTEEGKRLVGYMFLMDRNGYHGPQVAGPLTVWHYHTWARTRCLLENLLLVGDPEGIDRCAEGQPGQRSPEMLHVWLVDRPKGPFSTDMVLDREEIEVGEGRELGQPKARRLSSAP